MSGSHDVVEEAIRTIYAELPAWMMPKNDQEFDDFKPTQFEVRKFSNVRRVREALATIADYLGVDDV